MASETDRIFANFKEHSVAEFFKKNRQMLGFSGKTRSLTILVHEYVTNSLDACEEAGILPEISVRIDESGPEQYKIVIQDNGPGIPRKHLGKALGQMLAGTKFHRYAQQRGQQGIGASGCTMYAQITTGKPVHVISQCPGKRVTAGISVDLKTNSPLMANVVEEDVPGEAHGVRIEGEFGECKYDRSSGGAFEYIKRTALANPHATLTLIEPSGEKFAFPRSHEQVPPKPKEVQPHPLGLTVSDIVDLAHRNGPSVKLSQFLQNQLQRVSAAKVEELAKLLDGNTDGLPAVDFSKPAKDLAWPEAEGLVRAFAHPGVKWMAPASDCLRPIGSEQIKASLAHILAPDFSAVTERP
ncbi:MAG: DNA topoisomerase VI subunit B, partial [Candidatus Micrarchaeota archaeon]